MNSDMKPKLVAYLIEKNDLPSVKRRYLNKKVVFNNTLRAFFDY